MNFQMPTTTAAPATGGFSFGLSTAAPGNAGAKPPTFSLGTGSATAAKPLTFGAPAAAPAASTPIAGIGFGSGTPATAAAAPLSGFSGFGAPAAAATTTAAALPTLSGFGTATSTAAPTLPVGGLGGFGAAAPAATTAPTLSLGGFGATATPATTKPSLPVLSGFGTTPASTTAAAATTGFSLAKSTAAPTLGLGLGSTATVAPTTTSTGGFANLSTATKTTDSATVANSSQVTYNQLEEHINKWTLELEEQEKVFIEQATQINAWDKVLINNNQKILELNDAVQKVKNDQQVLEQELEFISTQHKELEESIAPLEKEFLKIPQVDVERTQTYLMVENLDTQLKQMSEDLKEIIDNLNEANKGQDNTDPIIQIGKILNAHMSSLQWIEASSSNISNKLDEIDKMHENFKRDSERSFRSAYYN